jgi:hypothetical protein
MLHRSQCVGEDLPGAQAPFVEDGRQDAFGISDLLAEHAAAGFGQAVTAAPSVASLFDTGGLQQGDAFGQFGEVLAAHAGQ